MSHTGFSPPSLPSSTTRNTTVSMESDLSLHNMSLAAPIVAAGPFTVIENAAVTHSVRSRSRSPSTTPRPRVQVFQQENNSSSSHTVHVDVNQFSAMQEQLNNIMSMQVNQQQFNIVPTEGTVPESTVSALLFAQSVQHQAEQAQQFAAASSQAQEAVTQVAAHANAAFVAKEQQLKVELEAMFTQHLQQKTEELRTMFETQIKQERQAHEAQLQNARHELLAQRQREQALQQAAMHELGQLKQQMAMQKPLSHNATAQNSPRVSKEPLSPRMVKSPASVRLDSPDAVGDWLKGGQREVERTPTMVRNLLSEFDNGTPVARHTSVPQVPFFPQQQPKGVDPQVQALQAQVAALGSMVQQMLNAQVTQTQHTRVSHNVHNVPPIRLGSTSAPTAQATTQGQPPSPPSPSSSSSSSSSGSNHTGPTISKVPLMRWTTRRKRLSKQNGCHYNWRYNSCRRRTQNQGG